MGIAWMTVADLNCLPSFAQIYTRFVVSSVRSECVPVMSSTCSRDTFVAERIKGTAEFTLFDHSANVAHSGGRAWRRKHAEVQSRQTCALKQLRFPECHGKGQWLKGAKEAKGALGANFTWKLICNFAKGSVDMTRMRSVDLEKGYLAEMWRADLLYVDGFGIILPEVNIRRELSLLGGCHWYTLLLQSSSSAAPLCRKCVLAVLCSGHSSTNGVRGQLSLS
ncbi:hypothetical protein VTK56DRAFT_8633 [Thermocarpiscus australiensis]